MTRAVLESFGGAESGRFREVAQSLVKHLHAFVSEVKLTEEEWFEGINFLTRTGHITDDKRQEFILLSDVLGVSMLVVGLNHRHVEGATDSGEGVEVVRGDGSLPTGSTEATVFGPFFVEGAPAFENGDDISGGAPGEPCFVSGRVLNAGGEPIPGARVDVWQADEEGFYDVQYDDLEGARGRGRLRTDEEGRYSFWSVKPEPYPIPYDGPVGDLLRAAGRSPMRPAHVHFMVQAPGYATLITHVFAEGDEHLDTDAVFGVKETLIAPFVRHDAGAAPDGRETKGPFYTMEYDLVLAPAGE
ncbi:hydroxyquinol 1,2-dioxygenase [Rubrobacter marinus]|uniref:Hydroxyquinol 1,2-dioxygenase n=1 Tax=Rubrobacter marinus TaxID=2653852 RepID=A0A6G8Q2S7_9ACTN|nr:hydroxyquinol 1,2-dioxygenase [Rubrobacter marinus]